MAAVMEFMVPKADDEAFNTAVYRFLELRRGAAGDGEAILTSEPFGPVVRKQLTLPSDAEMMDFTGFWSAFRRERPTPVRTAAWRPETSAAAQ